MRYDDEQTHIVKLEVRQDKGDTIGSPEEWSRTKVISQIERGTTFVTILQANKGKWHKGQGIHIITVHAVKYIRTDQNQTPSDNLGNLPEF